MVIIIITAIIIIRVIPVWRDGKGDSKRVMEEDKMSDRRNKDITGSNHGEIQTGSKKKRTGVQK